MAAMAIQPVGRRLDHPDVWLPTAARAPPTSASRVRKVAIGPSTTATIGHAVQSGATSGAEAHTGVRSHAAPTRVPAPISPAAAPSRSATRSDNLPAFSIATGNVPKTSAGTTAATSSPTLPAPIRAPTCNEYGCDVDRLASSVGHELANVAADTKRTCARAMRKSRGANLRRLHATTARTASVIIAPDGTSAVAT